MHQHHGRSGGAMHKASERRLLLLGNPNVGKSVIFHYFTGRYATVSNYPGTTVDVTTGQALLEGQSWEVVDSPGIQSLLPHSEDEKVTRDILLDTQDGVIIQVADAKNLRRALVITSQLADLGFPMLVSLNMWDEANKRGIQVDTQALSQNLGVEVVETIAVEGRGLSELRDACAKARPSSFSVPFDTPIEEGIRMISQHLPASTANPRGIALLLLSGDRELVARLLDQRAATLVNSVIEEVQSHYADPLSYVISIQRASRIDALVSRVLARGASPGENWKERLGFLTMHPLWGVPFLLAVLFLVFYLFVGRLGAGVGVDFLQSVVFNGYVNPWATRALELLPVPILQELLVGPYGLITMGLTYAIAIVLPIVGFFFFAFGLLEDSGYLPRLAILSNRILKGMGLNGKAVLPMVLGLGCVTMATMTTRILESRRERLIATLLLALGIPCSAQMAVILAMVARMSPVATILLVGIVGSQLLLVGFLAARLMPGESSDFVLEIPPLRLPHMTNILHKTMYAIIWFLREAVPLFLLGTFLLFLGQKVGALGWLEELARPVVSGVLGLPPRTAEAFIVGFLRRDYGAAGLLKMQQEGLLSLTQALVSLVVITLFVPCIANFFVIIKERGLRTALLMAAFIFPFAILVGGVVNYALRWWGVEL